MPVSVGIRLIGSPAISRQVHKVHMHFKGR
jgi:hypothetical protein